jgi:hypothetical protein
MLFKRTDAISDWYIWDAARAPYNEGLPVLFSSQAIAEINNPGGGFDFVSNGIKLRVGGGQNPNANGATYIYMAFAENPFKNALAR